MLPALNAYSITAPLRDGPAPPAPNDIPYTLKDKDCLGGFAPQTYEVSDLSFTHPSPCVGEEQDAITPVAKDYIFSFWVKETNPTAAPLLAALW